MFFWRIISKFLEGKITSYETRLSGTCKILRGGAATRTLRKDAVLRHSAETQQSRHAPVALRSAPEIKDERSSDKDSAPECLRCRTIQGEVRDPAVDDCKKNKRINCGSEVWTVHNGRGRGRASSS